MNYTLALSLKPFKVPTVTSNHRNKLNLPHFSNNPSPSAAAFSLFPLLSILFNAFTVGNIANNVTGIGLKLRAADTAIEFLNTMLGAKYAAVAKATPAVAPKEIIILDEMSYIWENDAILSNGTLIGFKQGKYTNEMIIFPPKS